MADKNFFMILYCLSEIKKNIPSSQTECYTLQSFFIPSQAEKRKRKNFCLNLSNIYEYSCWLPSALVAWEGLAPVFTHCLRFVLVTLVTWEENGRIRVISSAAVLALHTLPSCASSLTDCLRLHLPSFCWMSFPVLMPLRCLRSPCG